MAYLLMLAVAIAVVAMPLAIGNRYGRLKLISPMHILSYTLFLGVGVKTIGYFIDPSATAFEEFAPYSDALPTMGYIYMLGFVLMMCVGYLFAVGGKVPAYAKLRYDIRQFSVPLNDGKVMLILGACALLFIVVAGLYLGLRGGGFSLRDAFSLSTLYQLNVSKLERHDSGEFGLSFSYITIFFAILPIALAILFSQIYLRRRPSPLLLGAVGLVLLMVVFSALIRGKRADLLEIAATLVLVHMCFRPRINVRLVALGGVLAAAILMIFSVMTELRQNKGGNVDELALINVQPVIDQVVYSTYFLDINMTALIVEKMPEDQHKNGATYLDWVIGLIPRSIWANKPPISLGLFVKSEILNRPGSIGGFNPTQPGEAFVNFGWMGVFVGLVFGWAYRRLEMITTSTRVLHWAGGPWIYVVVVFPFVWSLAQTSFSIFFAGFLIEMVFCAAVAVGLALLGGRRVRSARGRGGYRDRIRQHFATDYRARLAARDSVPDPAAQ